MFVFDWLFPDFLQNICSTGQSPNPVISPPEHLIENFEHQPSNPVIAQLSLGERFIKNVEHQEQSSDQLTEQYFAQTENTRVSDSELFHTGLLHPGDSSVVPRIKKGLFDELRGYTCPLHPTFVTMRQLKNKTHAFSCLQCEL